MKTLYRESMAFCAATSTHRLYIAAQGRVHTIQLQNDLRIDNVSTFDMATAMEQVAQEKGVSLQNMNTEHQCLAIAIGKAFEHASKSLRLSFRQ